MGIIYICLFSNVVVLCRKERWDTVLTVLLGTDWVANRNEMLNMITADVKVRRGNRLLLVPELISHDTERRLAAAAGDTASRYAQVVSFSRLVRYVSEYCETAPIPCLDKGGRVVAMAAAVRQLNNKLKAYASVLTRPEFYAGLLDAVDEFKRCCISPEDLRLASQRSEGEFAQKLEELSLILESYESVTSRGDRDPRDQMNWLLEQMEACDFAVDHSFYVFGFPDLTRQHAAILEHAISNSENFVIAFTCEHAGSRAMTCEKAALSALDVITYAKNNGIAYTVKAVAPRNDALFGALGKMYQGNTDTVAGLENALTLVKTDSVYAECRCAAKKILSWVKNGCRFRDIGIVCSDIAAYENAMHLIFGRSGIPFYRSGTDDVLQKNVFEGIFVALKAALQGFEQQDVCRYMRSMLCELDTEICDKVENYAHVWRIQGKRWSEDWTFHPAGLTAKWTDADHELLGQLNDARVKLIAPLENLSRGIRSASSLAGQVSALVEYIGAIGLSNRLQELADYMDGKGDNRSAQILEQLWDILINALEQLHDILGETAWDEESFCRLLKLLLSQYDVGTIPTVLDAVMVGPVSAMRCHEVKHLLVLGAVEGLLPGYGGISGLLSDREREALRRLDVPLTGGAMEGLQTEFSEIFEVLTAATESVTLCCGDGQPSFLFNRLASIRGNVEEYEEHPLDGVTDPFEAAAWLSATGDEASAEALDISSMYEKLSAATDYDYGKITKDNIRGLYGKELALSASQIDRQANCRFSYFMRYGLRVDELKEASVDPAQFGTYFHAVLEKTADKVMQLGGFHEVSLEKTVELALQYSAEYIEENFGQLDSARMQYLFGRNVEELRFLIEELWNELSVSEFAPSLFEVGFGDGEQMPAVKIDGACIPAKMRGFVDRVDQWNDGHNNYFRVVDYKSGKKSFDYCDVFNGMGLQMLLYMYALEQNGEGIMGEHPLPVGVQYFSARFPFENGSSSMDAEQAAAERGKLLKRKGLLLQDEAVLRAMQPEGAPERLSVKIKKGAISGDCADRAQFGMLKKYVFHILRDLIKQIDSGVVSPNPYTRGGFGTCSYCPYGSICHKATVEGRRDYKTMDAGRFWAEVAKEVEDHG